MNKILFIKCQQQALTSDRVGVLELDDDKMLLTADGYTAVTMNRDDCKLDISRLHRLPKTVVDGIDEASELKLTCDCKYINSKRLVRRLNSVSGGESVYVNDKYIKLFGTGVSYKGDKSKVFVCEKYSGKLVGLIMPIRLKEDI